MQLIVKLQPLIILTINRDLKQAKFLFKRPQGQVNSLGLACDINCSWLNRDLNVTASSRISLLKVPDKKREGGGSKSLCQCDTKKSMLSMDKSNVRYGCLPLCSISEAIQRINLGPINIRKCLCMNQEFKSSDACSSLLSHLSECMMFMYMFIPSRRWVSTKQTKNMH